MPSENPAGGLAPGSRIGPYEIHSLLGAGGMGQVYRARDPHLGRDVAIKLLPEALAIDAERSARFEREARTLAALNHPHIAAIYGVEHLSGRTALVLELVEGETLSKKIGGRLSVADSLSIASQIADALEAAHEKGIVHRDLKPANVMIQARRGLQVKVLDFGLAKVDESHGTDPDISHSPTVSFAGTRHGVILGTAAYMSPEQTRGKPLDKRSDVWSFGCVLYEMLTGRRAFDGETVSDTIAAILGREPDWSALPADTPSGVRRLLERCLEKDVTRRLRDIGDVRVNLEHEIAGLSGVGGSHATTGVAPGRRSGLSALWLGVAAAVVVVLGIAVFWLYRRPPTATGPVEPAVQLTDFFDGAVAPALSPDGRMLTFIRGPDLFFSSSAPRGDIYVKMLAGDQAPLQLTTDGLGKAQPVFSPDGSRIIYTSVGSGFRWDSWQVGAMGQSPPRLFLQNASGLVWVGEREVLFSEITQNPRMKIVTSTEARGEPRDVYVPKGEGAMAHRSARSPDGRSVLVVEMDGAGWLPCRVVPFDGSSTGKQVGPLDGQCVTAAWSPDGRWMYFTSNSGGAFHLWRQEYPDGTPEQITFPPTEQEGTTVTPDGRYMITSQGLQQAAIWLHDDKGERQLTAEGFAMLPTISPSGRRMFYLMRTGPQRTYISGELWSMDLASGEQEVVLPGISMSGYSITQDGERVVYTSAGLSSGDGIWVANVDRQSRTPPRQLTRGGEFRAFAVGGGEIAYLSNDSVRHLYKMKEDGTGVQKISEQSIVFLLSASPDGRWALVAMPQAPGSDGNQIVFVSTVGEKPFVACDACMVGFGPGRLQNMSTFGLDGKSLFMPLRYYGRQTQRTVALPYDSRVPLERLWPKGLKSEEDVQANPGARLIPEGNAFPASGLTTYFAWRQTTRANIWKVPIPR